jgi:hypothetical protein
MGDVATRIEPRHCARESRKYTARRADSSHVRERSCVVSQFRTQDVRCLPPLNKSSAVRLHFQIAAYLQLMTYRVHAHECSG